MSWPISPNDRELVRAQWDIFICDKPVTYLLKKFSQARMPNSAAKPEFL